MKTWRQALREGLVSGSTASVASLVILALTGKVENGNGVAPANAISHWIWGRRATAQNEVSLRHTLVGCAIHHVASIFWATFYEKFTDRHQPPQPTRALTEQAATAAIACFVDFRLTPERFTPGFEHRLSKKSLLLVYAAFGVGLGLPAFARALRQSPNHGKFDSKSD